MNWTFWCVLAVIAWSPAGYGAGSVRCVSPDGTPIITFKPCAWVGGIPVDAEAARKDAEIARGIERSSAADDAERAATAKTETEVAASVDARVSAGLAAQREVEARRAADADLGGLLVAKERFEAVYRIAEATPRVSLAGPVGELAALKASAASLEVSACYRPARGALVDWMEGGITRMLNFMKGWSPSSDLEAYRDFERGFYLAAASCGTGK